MKPIWAKANMDITPKALMIESFIYRKLYIPKPNSKNLSW
jgi:hypothetical protein